MTELGRPGSLEQMVAQLPEADCQREHLEIRDVSLRMRRYTSAIQERMAARLPLQRFCCGWAIFTEAEGEAVVRYKAFSIQLESKKRTRANGLH